MEDNFLKDDFEQFLKGNADEFLMVPQRKVWYSIYNSMHPDRKWPSLAVCVLILTAILFLGISNNNSISDAARKAGAENMSDIAKNYAAQNIVHLLDPVSAFNKKSPVSPDFSMRTASKDDLDENTDVYADLTARNELPPVDNIANTNFTPENSLQNNSPVVISAGEKGVVISAAPNTNTHQNKNTHTTNQLIKDRLIASATVSADDVIPADNNASVTFDKIVSANKDLSLNETDNLKKLSPAATVNLTNDQRAWIDNFEFYNRPAAGKFKKNSSISYYVTPSLGYRSINRKTGYTPAGTLILQARTLPSLYQALLDGATLNLEAGAALNYSVSKKIRLKGGVQFNYMNYLSSGTEFGHPVQTYVATMNRSEPIVSSTTFSVDGNNTKFNHRSIQVALPLGADIKLSGNNKVKWYAGGTLQPTFIMGGNSLVLSADEKSLISDVALRRNWNLNMAVETFVSYKTRSGIIFNAGPQFRYQMLSSFKKPYAYNERPYNFGVKLGITKGF